MTDEEIVEKVRNGVTLLDAQMPDWRQRVRVDLLDFGSHFLCVLGQVYETFGRGLVVLGIEHSYREFGFACPVGGPCQCDRLVEAWRKEVSAVAA